MSPNRTRPAGPTADRAGRGGGTHDRTTFQTDLVHSAPARYALAFLRIVLGWLFLWPFLDKLFGLGYSTAPERAWINGGTPAQGFMNNTEGPFSGLFTGMAGALGGVADWVFMLGLLGLGVALLTGCGLRIAAVAGTLLLAFMWLATFPFGQEGQTNPITTSHWIEAAGIIVVATTLAGDTLGLGKWWGKKVGNSWLR